MRVGLSALVRRLSVGRNAVAVWPSLERRKSHGGAFVPRRLQDVIPMFALRLQKLIPTLALVDLGGAVVLQDS